LVDRIHHILRCKPIRCDERNKCRECPFGRKPEDREHQEVSWNEMVDKGYDPAAHDSTSEPALNRITYQEIRAEWNAADPRLTRAFEMSESGYDIEDIMAERRAAPMVELPMVVLRLTRHLLIELHQLDHAVRFCNSFDWESISRHDGAVIILVGSPQLRRHEGIIPLRRRHPYPL
jgi:hypothetical protein